METTTILSFPAVIILVLFVLGGFALSVHSLPRRIRSSISCDTLRTRRNMWPTVQPAVEPAVHFPVQLVMPSCMTHNVFKAESIVSQSCS